MKRTILFFLVTLIISCSKNKYSDQELTTMLNANSIDSIIDAIEIIREDNNVKMAKVILQKSDDPRITHKKGYYGKSIYEIKLKAVRDLSQISSPYEISYRPDSQVIKFYLQKIK